MSKPSNFLKQPMDSVIQKSEAEIVARNIMVILSRTGDMWRTLEWNEYEAGRHKDGEYADMEHGYFDQVSEYCRSEVAARTFSPVWAEVAEESLLEEEFDQRTEDNAMYNALRDSEITKR